MNIAGAVDAQMVAELKTAIKECSERGLSVASKWCVTQRKVNPRVMPNLQHSGHRSSTYLYHGPKEELHSLRLPLPRYFLPRPQREHDHPLLQHLL